MIKVQLLGTVAAWREDGTRIALKQAKLRIVLATLALDAGSAVSTQRLIEVLWGPEPPRSAQKSLQSYVSRLRSALGTAPIVRSGSAYLLDLDPKHVDVGRFRLRLQAGDAAGALAEWSGPPLEGLETAELEGAIAALEEQRLSAVESTTAAMVQQEPQRAIVVLTELTSEHPFRERLWALLMTALYRSGRQADALAVFQAARRRMVEELGVEPGAELRALEQRILDHDPGLGGAPAGLSPAAVALSAAAVVPPATQIIGRAVALNELDAAVSAHRLVTVAGVGGVGKTSIAQLVAAAASDRFDDGASFVELASLSHGGLVPVAVAQALGITAAGDITDPATVASALASWRRLVVLDNCEHVLDEVADLVGLILRRAPDVKVLATSREPLGLAAELVYRLDPLELEGDAGSPAVELFKRRAEAIVSGFVGDDESLVEICRRLDGLPLAIELAAARMTSMTPTEFLAAAGERSRLLSGAGRRGVARHRSLEDLIGWSHDLLDETERAVFTACSVFAGGFDVISAEAVVDPSSGDGFDMLDVLDSLVRKSLLVVHRVGGRTRFDWLETVRQFGQQQLVRTGRHDAVRDRHAEFFADQTRAMFEVWDSPRQAKANIWLGREFANLRAAHRWSLDHGDIGRAATIAVHATVIGLVVQTREPIIWAEQTIEAAQKTHHPSLANLYLMAGLCGMLDRHEDGIRYGLHGAELSQEPGMDAGPLGLTAGWAGIAHMSAGDTGSFIDLNLRDVNRGADRTGFAEAAATTGLAYLDRVTPEMTRRLIDKAERGGNPTALAFALFATGHAFRKTDPEVAREALSRCVQLALASKIDYFADAARNRLAALHYDDPATAIELFDPSVRGFHQSSDPGNTFAVLGNLALFLERAGELETAARLMRVSSTPMVIAVQPEIREATERLSATLGTERFEAYATEGETMPRADLVRLALRSLQDLRQRLTG